MCPRNNVCPGSSGTDDLHIHSSDAGSFFHPFQTGFHWSAVNTHEVLHSFLHSSLPDHKTDSGILLYTYICRRILPVSQEYPFFLSVHRISAVCLLESQVPCRFCTLPLNRLQFCPYALPSVGPQKDLPSSQNTDPLFL